MDGISFRWHLLVEFLEFFADLLECFLAGCKDAGTFAVKGSEEMPGFMISSFVKVFVYFVSNFVHACFSIVVQLASDDVSERAYPVFGCP